jgi:nucleoside-diphosphate-sugar epimerase
MPPKRVLVTGAGGFIGRWSVPSLRALGFEVHAALSDGSARRTPRELDGARIHAVDLLDAAATDALIAAVLPTHLLHFAWTTTPGVYWSSPENARWLAASQALLQAFVARGGRRVVMAGSCAEYDWSRVDRCDELSSPLGSAGGTMPAYVACKIAMARELASVGREAGVSTAWGRVFFQFGPHEHADRLVPSVVRSLLENREAHCSHGRQVRSFLHVADVGAAFAALLNDELTGPVNIGSDEPLSIGALVEAIARHIGRPDLVRLGAKPAPAGEPAVLLPETRRLRDELGWRPRFTLVQGLADTIDWWRRELRA